MFPLAPTLLQAIDMRYNEGLQRLLLQGADIGIMQDTACRTPLTYAVQCNNIDAVRLLLIAGSDPNLSNGGPLLSAAENGNVKIAELLWIAGAQLDIMDNAAYRFASEHRHTHFVDWLKSKMDLDVKQ
jgi:ankyrin repeat protein